MRYCPRSEEMKVEISYVIIILVIVCVIIFFLEKCPRKEGWYFNPERICLMGSSYPDYWAQQYGKYGERWPYRKKIAEYDKFPTHCGGCWSFPSPITMFAE